ncbi:hypothetical protein [Streptomyces sp. NPDC058374]|uniref:hypothetical protein n=1 Tax=unclassified Streptomyces TaxID=2593676 RepID=UPI003659E885
MSVPEENREKTPKTDPAAEGDIEQKRPQEDRPDDQQGESRTMGEALEEADVKPEDYEE